MLAWTHFIFCLCFLFASLAQATPTDDLWFEQTLAQSAEFRKFIQVTLPKATLSQAAEGVKSNALTCNPLLEKSKNMQPVGDYRSARNVFQKSLMLQTDILVLVLQSVKNHSLPQAKLDSMMKDYDFMIQTGLVFLKSAQKTPGAAASPAPMASATPPNMPTSTTLVPLALEGSRVLVSVPADFKNGTPFALEGSFEPKSGSKTLEDFFAQKTEYIRAPQGKILEEKTLTISGKKALFAVGKTFVNPKMPIYFLAIAIATDETFESASTMTPEVADLKLAKRTLLSASIGAPLPSDMFMGLPYELKNLASFRKASQKNPSTVFNRDGKEFSLPSLSLSVSFHSAGLSLEMSKAVFMDSLQAGDNGKLIDAKPLNFSGFSGFEVSGTYVDKFHKTKLVTDYYLTENQHGLTFISIGNSAADMEEMRKIVLSLSKKKGQKAQ